MNRDQIDKHTEIVRAVLKASGIEGDLCHRALSSLATLRTLALDSVDRPGWEPISTAPKDGSHIFLWFPATRVDAGVVCEGFFDAIFDQVWMLTRGRGTVDQRVREPTHWMPLPEGPCTPKR